MAWKLRRRDRPMSSKNPFQSARLQPPLRSSSSMSPAVSATRRSARTAFVPETGRSRKRMWSSSSALPKSARIIFIRSASFIGALRAALLWNRGRGWALAAGRSIAALCDSLRRVGTGRGVDWDSGEWFVCGGRRRSWLRIVYLAPPSAELCATSWPTAGRCSTRVIGESETRSVPMRDDSRLTKGR